MEKLLKAWMRYGVLKVGTRPVDFPIPGVEVNEPVEPEVIEKVELDLKGRSIS
ncbi:MAG: hypothetical protein ACLR1V_01810 [Coprococcus sp.]